MRFLSRKDHLLIVGPYVVELGDKNFLIYTYLYTYNDQERENKAMAMKKLIYLFIFGRLKKKKKKKHVVGGSCTYIHSSSKEMGQINNQHLSFNDDDDFLLCTGGGTMTSDRNLE